MISLLFYQYIVSTTYNHLIYSGRVLVHILPVLGVSFGFLTALCKIRSAGFLRLGGVHRGSVALAKVIIDAMYFST